MYYELCESWLGYMIRKPYRENHWCYVSSVYKGKYKFVVDFTHAKHFSKKTALKHIEILKTLEN